METIREKLRLNQRFKNSFSISFIDFYNLFIKFKKSSI